VLVVSNFPVYKTFELDFRNIPTVWYLFSCYICPYLCFSFVNVTTRVRYLVEVKYQIITWCVKVAVTIQMSVIFVPPVCPETTAYQQVCLCALICKKEVCVWALVFNTTFNNVSVALW
jgi:hypothetical protein